MFNQNFIFYERVVFILLSQIVKTSLRFAKHNSNKPESTSVVQMTTKVQITTKVPNWPMCEATIVMFFNIKIILFK